MATQITIVVSNGLQVNKTSQWHDPKQYKHTGRSEFKLETWRKYTAPQSYIDMGQVKTNQPTVNL